MDTTAVEHTLTITDLESLAEYPWVITTPFPLSLTDDQVTAIMQTIASGLPATTYGFKVTASIKSTTTTTTQTQRAFAPVQVPGTPAP